MGRKMRLNLQRSYQTLNSNAQNIKNADRNPVENVQNAIAELNGFSQQHESEHASIKWVQGVDQMGPCLHATIKFKNVEKCLKFAKEIYDLQESSDHHSNFIIDNFLTVDLKLSTHQPVPAITHVDFMFARELIDILFS